MTNQTPPEQTPTDKARPPAVEMRGIVKTFPGVLAVNEADFIVGQSEIHALLGENGAGKSTLMSILAGRLTPDAGVVRLFGRRLKPGSPKAAIEAGLGMVYQHLKLVPSLTVTENLLLGRDRGKFKAEASALSDRVVELGEKFGLPVDPAAPVWRLSLGERQRVEILRLLLFEAKVLVLDEPTAILTPLETKELFKALKNLREMGRSIVFISHKMDEVMELSDRVTVLNRGKDTARMEIKDATKQDLARLMIASDWEPPKIITKPPDEARLRHPVVELQKVTVKDALGVTRLDRVDLNIYPGEVLGVAGVAGNGQRELAEVCTGSLNPSQGRIVMAGKDMTQAGPAEFIAAGVGFVPEDRHGSGCVTGLNLIENLLLKDYRADRFSKGQWINWKAAKQNATDLIKAYDVRPPDPLARAGALSGGNLQKLLLARELSRKPKLVVAAYPLRGLDLASAGFVQQVLNRHRDDGGAVLFIGEDLDSLLEASDRVVVLFRGRIMGIFPNRNLSPEKLGLLMAGDEQQSGASA